MSLGYNSGIVRRKGPLVVVVPHVALHVAMHVALLCGLAALGCAGASQAPTRTVDAYAAALARGDYATAYGMMSARYQREHPKDAFVRLLKDSPTEVKETRQRLGAGRQTVEVRARVTYGDLRDELALVREGDTWRIDGDPLSFYPQDTPEQALRSFLRALDLRRWEVVLRFVPEAYAKNMTPEQVREEFEGPNAEENRAMRALLKAETTQTITREGDTARLPFGDRFEVRFLREGGRWKIEDPY